MFLPFPCAPAAYGAEAGGGNLVKPIRAARTPNFTRNNIHVTSVNREAVCRVHATIGTKVRHYA